MKQLIFIIFFPYFLRRLFFYLNFLQVKEYRFDRVFDEIKRKKSIFFSRQFFLALFCLLPLSLSKKLFFVVPFFYFLLSLYSLFSLKRKRWILPQFTFKMVLFFVLSFSFILLIIFSRPNFLFLPIFDLLIFPYLLFLNLLFLLPTNIAKELIIKKATRKIKKFPRLITIGITGSYGKTSTKEFLSTILSEKFKVLKTEGNVNTPIGVAMTILKNLKKEHEIFVCEMAAYKKGEVKKICKITKPKIGIVCGLNEQHLALFGSMENLISGEGGKELIESLPEDGLVIFNGENEILRKIYKETKLRKKIVGKQNKNFDLFAANIKVKKEVLFFQVFSKEGEIADFNLKLIGEQNIETILLAACCAMEFGMNLKEISKACQKITQDQTGIKLIKTKSGFNVLDATYSANPNSVLSHLDYLKVWEGKRAILMPCLIELGPKSREIHQKIGKKIKEVCHLAIIVTKDYFKEIKKEAGEKAVFLEDPKKILEKLLQFKEKNDIVLLEGRLPKNLTKLILNGTFN